MNSTINIYCNPLLDEYNKQIETILNSFNMSNKQKNLILYKNINLNIRDTVCNNINILKLINLNYCNECNKYADYIGLCVDHFNQNLINKYINEYYEYINNHPEHNEYIQNYLHEYHKIIVKYKNMCKQILDCYNKNTLVTFDMNKNINYTQYINKIYDIDYDKINVYFDKNIVCDLIEQYNLKQIEQIDIIILIKFLHRKYKFDTYIYENIFIKNKPTNIFIGNNNILFNHIFNSNLIYNIEYIDTEYPVNINGHTLRFDIYIIMKVMDISCDKPRFRYFKLVIETDENHHYNINSNTSDKLKDKYCIENELSLLRIDVTLNNNKLSEQNIEFCLFFMKYLITIKEPIYYFSSKYIDTHKNKLQNININDINIDDILKFGSKKKSNTYNIIDIKKIYDIENIDYYIKNNLPQLIKQFAYNYINEDNEDNEKNDEKYNNIINLHTINKKIASNKNLVKVIMTNNK